MTNFTFYKKIIHAAAFFTGCCFVLSCENDVKVVTDFTKKVVMKEEAINVVSFLSQEGKLRAILKAPLMIRVFGDTVYAEFPKSLHCDFYDSSTVIETWLDSRKGKYYENLNKVYLWDSVVVISRSGDTLKCQDLWWDQNTKLFYSDNYAEYLTPDRKIYPGKGLEATQDFSRITFRYPTGQLKVKEDGFPQ
ncbi:MAG: LPS export ABC transporter periplasmic protein LptC [Bacteroidota bacterium]|mgnify:CR=1 FL=1|nr:LPS export ABC transporter periplasmic protein LptC [Bacteroidota bacterium]